MKQYKDYSPTRCDTKGLKLPNKQNWLVSPIIQTRDSDALDRSNFRTAKKMFEEVDSDENDHEVCSFGHWACGWFEIIIVKPGTMCEEEALKIEAELEEYPVLDEEDFCLLEYEENCEEEE